MKKKLIVLLLAAVMLCGCSPTDAPTEPTAAERTDRDAQMKYFSSVLTPISESGDILYAIKSEHIHYFDRVSGVSDVLCPDPSCMHTNKSCVSYVQSFCPLFTCYDGQVYWMGTTTPYDYRSLCLHRCNLDGTGQENVKELDFEKWSKEYNPQEWALHRGKLFFQGRSTQVNGTEATYRITFGYLPLDAEEETILYETTETNGSMGTMFLCGDKAYYAVSAGGGLKVYCYDLNDYTSEVLVDREQFPSHGLISLWVEPDGTVYVGTSQDVYEVKDGAVTKKVSFDHESSCPYLLDGIAVVMTVEDDYSTLEIRSYDGELIYQGKTFPQSAEGFDETLGMRKEHFAQAILGGDSEKLIVEVCSTQEDIFDTFLLDIRDNMKATYLWSGGLVGS